MGVPADIFNKRTVGIGIACIAAVFAVILTWNFWFLEEPLVTDEKKVKAPFELSSKDVIFEIGAGHFVIIKPKPNGVKRPVEVKIVFDDQDVIDTIGSFTLQPESTKSIFIPMHSKGRAGHCVMSFKTNAGVDLPNLFKLQVKVKVVHHMFLGYLSILLGWAYFLGWSFTYYPQIYKNWKRKSVVGFSFDYVALNITGHMCYLVFNAAMYNNGFIQHAYLKLHPKSELPVKANDVLFSIHAVCMNCILIMQICTYERGGQKVSTMFVTLVSGLWLSIFGGLMACITEKMAWLQYLYYLSYIKVGTTPIKYTPQVYLNFINKNTDGWSIHAVGFDAVGALCSLSQMLLETFDNDDLYITFGNPGKLGLALIGFLYDGIFFSQHLLYNRFANRKRKGEETEQLYKDIHKKLQEVKSSMYPHNVRVGKLYKV